MYKQSAFHVYVGAGVIVKMDTKMSNIFYKNTLEKRSKRLVELLEISAPEQLISREAMLVVEAALGYCGKATSMVGNWLISKVSKPAVRYSFRYAKKVM